MELIKVFDNVLDNSMCNHIINIYENNPNCQKSGITSGGYNPNTKLTTDISISNHIHIDFWKIIEKNVEDAFGRIPESNETNFWSQYQELVPQADAYAIGYAKTGMYRELDPDFCVLYDAVDWKTMKGPATRFDLAMYCPPLNWVSCIDASRRNTMSILDKAKGFAESVSGAVTGFDSDEAIANTIIKAVEKQEKVNALLKAKGAKYRVSDIELGMGIPPSVTFGVRQVDDGETEETNGG